MISIELLITLVAALGLALTLFYCGRAFWSWVAPSALCLVSWGILSRPTWTAIAVPAGILLLVALIFGFRPLRRCLVTAPLMPRLRGLLPRLGDTERVALEAGTIWWDADLFSGRPDWRRLLSYPPSELSAREREFLDGPVEELCRMVDDWEVMQRRDLSAETWEFIKRERFWAMIIPERYGGLEFSAAAHSAVITKLSSRSVTAAVTVMVPNSLGPAELLLHYGTDEQKEYYLPRLARGEEIPCFALTGPEAGSDAAATQSVGIVERGEFEGEEVLGMRLDWQKRYITLGPVSTVIGLAFRLLDPNGLLGDEEDLGITCALIPSDLPGIEIGERHDALGIPFENGPNEGHDVFVPLDFIIGGRDGAGNGWRMLMESLSAGRAVSLPSLAVGASQLAARVVSAYAMVREQFDNPIGRFEGVEEPLARIAGTTYLINATRRVTLAALDQGEQPPVISGIVKCYLTEAMRDVINDAMDIRAGAGIMRGPRNVLATAHMAVPVGITVEGANILTRTLIIYGQGVMRCHPYLLDEIHALEAGDAARFDRAFFRHVGHPFVMAARSLVLGLSGALPARLAHRGPSSGYIARLSRLSACFALVSEGALVALGPNLKRKEKISGRLADALAWLYLGSCAVKDHHDHDHPDRDGPFLEWTCHQAVGKIEQALLGVIDNLPVRPLAWLLRPLVFPLGVRQRSIDDRLGSRVAECLLDDRLARGFLTRDIYLPAADEPGLGRLEAALGEAREALDVEKKIRAAVRAGRLERAPGDALAERALAEGIITAEEREQLHQADEARREAIQVDSFDAETYRSLNI